MSKTLYLKSDNVRSSGIDITYVKSRNALEIGGWYGLYIGIECTTMPLPQFFRELGITPNILRKTIKQMEGK